MDCYSPKGLKYFTVWPFTENVLTPATSNPTFQIPTDNPNGLNIPKYCLDCQRKNSCNNSVVGPPLIYVVALCKLDKGAPVDNYCNILIFIRKLLLPSVRRLLPVYNNLQCLRYELRCPGKLRAAASVQSCDLVKRTLDLDYEKQILLPALKLSCSNPRQAM